ncbi:hypothetical protein XarbCFBP8130_05400 [Xanthomonas arboricola]|nr:hypothetical protein XarbCFBP8153_10070 [Xanthomonas arboricola]PPT65306.1 hypothetical protein XarbCFBP8130_05400 [Xanthomonas arboricola]
MERWDWGFKIGDSQNVAFLCQHWPSVAFALSAVFALDAILLRLSGSLPGNTADASGRGVAPDAGG